MFYTILGSLDKGGSPKLFKCSSFLSHEKLKSIINLRKLVGISLCRNSKSKDTIKRSLNYESCIALADMDENAAFPFRKWNEKITRLHKAVRISRLHNHPS